jgi:hypothetical protein
LARYHGGRDPVQKHPNREPGDKRFREVVLSPVFLGDQNGKESRGPGSKKPRFCGVEFRYLLGNGTAGSMKLLSEHLEPGVEIKCTPELYCLIPEGQGITGKGCLL